MTNKTAKKNKKVFREGVVEIHGRFQLDGEGNPELITAKGASRCVKSVEVDNNRYTITLNMPKATFLGAPAVTYIDTGTILGSIFTPVVSDIVSTPAYNSDPNVAQNPTHLLPSFDITIFNADNEVVPLPEGAVCAFTVTVSTSVVPNGMLPNWEDEVVVDPPSSVAARTAIGGNAIVHTPKVESVTAYGRFYGEFADWAELYTYGKDNKVKLDFKYYVALQTSTGIEPGVTLGWEAYWKEIGLLITTEAESEGVLSVVLNDNLQYPDLPANVYVITLDPPSPVVQFLGAAVAIPFAKSAGLSSPAYNTYKVFCEGVVLDSNGDNVYGTSANQIVLAFYNYDPQIAPVTSDVMHFTINYTTSNVF